MEIHFLFIQLELFKILNCLIGIINTANFVIYKIYCLAYGESKLATALHMRKCAELNKKVRFFSVHPGIVHTELSNDMTNRMGSCGSIDAVFRGDYF